MNTALKGTSKVRRAFFLIGLLLLDYQSGFAQSETVVKAAKSQLMKMGSIRESIIQYVVEVKVRTEGDFGRDDFNIKKDFNWEARVYHSRFDNFRVVALLSKPKGTPNRKSWIVNGIANDVLVFGSVNDSSQPNQIVYADPDLGPIPGGEREIKILDPFSLGIGLPGDLSLGIDYTTVISSHLKQGSLTSRPDDANKKDDDVIVIEHIGSKLWIDRKKDYAITKSQLLRTDSVNRTDWEVEWNQPDKSTWLPVKAKAIYAGGEIHFDLNWRSANKPMDVGVAGAKMIAKDYGVPFVEMYPRK